MKLTTISLMIILTLGLCVTPLATEAQQVGQGTVTIREGTYEGGHYRIKVPAYWNGGLVVFAHGYQSWCKDIGHLHVNPLEGYLAALGYASAASG